MNKRNEAFRKMFCDKILKTLGILDVLNRAFKSEFGGRSLREIHGVLSLKQDDREDRYAPHGNMMIGGAYKCQ